MKWKVVLSVLLKLVILTACSNNSSPKEEVTDDIKRLVQDYSIGNIKDEVASITSKQLIVTKADNSEAIYRLPEEEFFVSIAPYITETHPCTNHNLTGCQGEMVEEKLHVYIEDDAENVVIDQTLETEKNGFFDLWLPRDKKYNITIEHDGKKVQSQFSTFEKDGTCITTMQLT